MDNEKKLVIEFKDGTRKVIENVIDFYFDVGGKTFFRVSNKGRSYCMFVAYDCVKYMEVIE